MRRSGRSIWQVFGNHMLRFPPLLRQEAEGSSSADEFAEGRWLLLQENATSRFFCGLPKLKKNAAKHFPHVAKIGYSFLSRLSNRPGSHSNIHSRRDLRSKIITNSRVKINSASDKSVARPPRRLIGPCKRKRIEKTAGACDSGNVQDIHGTIHYLACTLNSRHEPDVSLEAKIMYRIF